MAEEEIGLLMEIDIYEEEDSPEETSSAESADSDEDEGEIGEMGEVESENDEEDGDDNNDDIIQAYQHEPPPRDSDSEEEENDGDAPRLIDPERLENNDWCLCGGHCQVLPSFQAGDCVCCQEIPEVVKEAKEQDTECITQAESFDNAILDPVSIYIGWLSFTEKWRRRARSFGERNNEKYRYVAYRSFVRWCWGFLGKDIRVQLPACVQAKVKLAYPDAAGRYRGTILRRLEL